MRKLAALLLCFDLHLFAWGPMGHSLVARIAEAQLTPAVRARVAAILGPRKTMASVASWADEVRVRRRDTANWHYIDIQITDKHLVMARDCPMNNCVLAKIPDLRRTLQDPAATPQQKAEALMFLIHFVGDMHQPLHCADNRDRGGNQLAVRLAGRATNLHSAWDSGMLARTGSEAQLFETLSKESAKHAAKWRKGTVADWAKQSHAAAKEKVYGKLPKAVAPDRPIELDVAYVKMADPIIHEQIARAGARLAGVINETLGAQ